MLKKVTVLKTERLCLRPFCDTDLENALALFYNDEIKKTYMLPDFASREEAVKLFENLKSRSHSEERFVYGIYFQNKLIGFLNDVEKDDDIIEVGYVIHPDMQNRGFATESLTAAIQELFRIGYATVKAGFFEENHASGRVMEKSGMKRIDLTEEIDYRGKTHHCIFYEIRKKEIMR